MNLGVQYYRPPFPNSRHWADDFRRIRDSGLNTVQLWVLWGWVEATPGKFEYGDYDRLVELAGKNKLGVVLSTIAEIQPCWIHREVPGSEMVTNMGAKVISSNRCECHFGITPGGCADHPGVWERMSRFLATTVKRYRSAPPLVGWDAWNELRWNVQADGLVCYCEHTLEAFRRWLDAKHGGLAGLNRAWQRRYSAWDEVMPGKKPDRPYTEMMAWQHFITSKCDRHGQARYDLMKALDPRHPVTVHAGEPCAQMAGGGETTAINRGNDWFFADGMDGVGTSSFPKWGNMDDADFGMRVEFVKSAAQGKRVWLSEVQGGRAATGFDVHVPVDALSQQRWIWNGLACGADTILFWCWRDEVFGRESGGFGVAGADGLAGERLAALRATGKVLGANARLIDGYQPAKPRVGVLFSPQSHYLCWAQEGSARRAVEALKGYARALVRKSIPYTVVEEAHLGALDGLKVLFLPRTIVAGPELGARLAAFVRGGGTLVCESECGAFSPVGIYRYPEERFLKKLAGIEEVGRRTIGGPFEAAAEGRKFQVEGTQWLTPFRARKARAWAACADGLLAAEVPAGKGRVIMVGTYPGEAYLKGFNPGFEDFVELAVERSGWKPEIEVLAPRPTRDAFLYVKSGSSGGKRAVFVFFPAGQDLARLRFRKGFFGTGAVRDILSGGRCELARGAGGGEELVLSAPASRISVLVGK